MSITTITAKAPARETAARAMAGTVYGHINYYFPGEISKSKDLIPGSAGYFRRRFDTHLVEITDIRGQEDDFSLEKNGFQLVAHSSAEELFEDQEAITSTYYAEVVEVLKKTTGASYAQPFSHVVRRTPYEEILKEVEERGLDDNNRVDKVGPAHFTHIDLGPVGAQQVYSESLSEQVKARVSDCRWGIINVWRPIKTVQRDPLAVCDFRSVLDEDLHPVYLQAPKSYTGYDVEKDKKSAAYETLAGTYNPAHKWYYASGMTPDEVLLVRIFDSNKAVDGTEQRALHSSFAHPEFDRAEARESIETRCLVFWEDQKRE